jgi:hypothetical protein
MKIHNAPFSSRPILSQIGALVRALGTRVDDKLQQFARRQQTYFKSSFKLKNILDQVVVPRNSFLFTADAVSMYTNIPTDKALRFMSKQIHSDRRKFPNIPAEALIAALHIVMKYNIFTFCDTIWKQYKRTSMVDPLPPVPTFTTPYVSSDSYHTTLKTFSCTTDSLMKSSVFVSSLTLR